MTKILNDEEQKKLERKKKIAMLRASNELLEESKKKVMENTKLDELSRAQRVKDIERAQEENFVNAEKQNIATRQEIMDAEYGEVSQEYIDKYNEHLKKKGITDEDVRKKTQTVVTGSGESEKTANRKRISRKEKKTLEENAILAPGEVNTVPLSVEQEVMNSSRIADDEDLDKVVADRERKRRSDAAKPKDEFTEAVKDNIDSKKVVVAPVNEHPVEVKPKRQTKKNAKIEKAYEFDFSTIPANVQFDMIPLPSKGECYAHKCSRIPVAYLNATDESIISSPNMYRDGKILDVILKRKILDKNINVDELVKGDRDAIILWLRATGYGVDFPVVVTHPKTRKKYDISVKLDSFKYYDFDLVGDENGYFDYITENGDVLKYKLFSESNLEELKSISRKEDVNVNTFYILKSIATIDECVNELTGISNDQREDLKACVSDVRDIVDEIRDEDSFDENTLFADLVIKQLKLQTMAVNGNYDREYVENYVDNMRAGEARRYRTYIGENVPGVDFTVKVDIPQDEGGSFDTFLRLDDSVFLNV